MAEQSDIADVIKSIQADVTTIVKGEIELAKAELMPQAKAAGIGAGLFGAAAFLGATGGLLLLLGLSFWLSLGFQSWFGLDLLAALALGFAVIALLFFILAGILALIGKGQLKFTGPKATVANAEATVAAVKGAVEKGKQDVADLSLTGRRPELERGTSTGSTAGRTGTSGGPTRSPGGPSGPSAPSGGATSATGGATSATGGATSTSSGATSSGGRPHA